MYMALRYFENISLPGYQYIDHRNAHDFIDYIEDKNTVYIANKYMSNESFYKVDFIKITNENNSFEELNPGDTYGFKIEQVNKDKTPLDQPNIFYKTTIQLQNEMFENGYRIWIENLTLSRRIKSRNKQPLLSRKNGGKTKRRRKSKRVSYKRHK